MRNKRAAVSILNASLLPDGDNISNRCIWCSWSHEVRRIIFHFLYYLAQLLHLIRSCCINVRPVVRLPAEKTLTVPKMTSVDQSRTNTHEQNTLILVLSAKLSNYSVHCCLAASVQRSSVHIKLVDQV